MKGCRNGGRGWGRTQEFRKVWARAPEVENGAKKGPQKIFKILNFENVEIFRNSLVPP